MNHMQLGVNGVQRRIGGLESGSIKIRKHEPVQRRIGGLVVLLNKLKN